MDGAADKAAELANAWTRVTMSIYLNKDSRIIVQGMTGGMGSKHTTLMIEAGSTSSAGSTPARQAPPLSSPARSCRSTAAVKEAMAETGADVSGPFVPPAFTKDACIEAIDAGSA